jgi:hypothetical protein
MRADLWRIFVSLGVPGLALGVLYMLFQHFKWQFPKVPRRWVGPIIVLFITVTGVLVYSALYFWAPVRPSLATGPSFVSNAITNASVAGHWSAEVVWARNTKDQWGFTFETLGDDLFGTAFTWDGAPRDIREGQIKGDQIFFKIVWKDRPMYGSTPAYRDFWTTFRGQAGKDKIHFTMQREDDEPFKFTAVKDAPKAQ